MVKDDTETLGEPFEHSLSLFWRKSTKKSLFRESFSERDSATL